MPDHDGLVVFDTAHADNSTAQRQQNEPWLTPYYPERTIWWNWTALSNCIVFVDTAGSAFDTSLGVFTGTNLSKLTLVIENDDDPTNSPSSSVKFEAVAGTTYDIFVGTTVPSELGDIVLNLRTLALPPDNPGAAPANDFRTNGVPLTGTNVTTFGSDAGAGAEPAEPRAAGLLPRKSVWWTWTASERARCCSRPRAAIGQIPAPRLPWLLVSIPGQPTPAWCPATIMRIGVQAAPWLR